MQRKPITGQHRHTGDVAPAVCAPSFTVPAIWAFLFFALAGLPVLVVGDYLSDIDAEVKKVEARKIDGETGGSVVEAPAELSVSPPEAGEGVSRDAFESLLQQHYLGTYGFYKKLPERSRQEIFADYRAGAPISEVRKKIIDRLLQR